MPNTIALACPLDDLALRTALVPIRGDLTRDAAIHLHLEVEETAQCANGHRWRVEGMLTMHRLVRVL